MKKWKITLSSVVVASTDQVSCQLGDEVVLLNLKDGAYYGLDTCGATVWEMIKTPIKVSELRDALLSTFDVEDEQCTSDLLGLLEQLAQHGLVEIREVEVADGAV